MLKRYQIKFRMRNCVLLTFLAFLAGCTTYVGKIEKLDGYDKKLARVAVAWHKPFRLNTEIRKSSQAGKVIITAEEKANSKQGIDTLLSIFSERSVKLVVD